MVKVEILGCGILFGQFTKVGRMTINVQAREIHSNVASVSPDIPRKQHFFFCTWISQT